uniref:AAA family ATPase n=1 Tax=uncultured Treponema sp. TaxID=162155 RepID=UPI0025D6F461
PNYSYAQFVGTYKPVQDSADENQIKYEYIPGPFMRIYVAAKQNPSQNFLLLIEEINRANVAAVFGDVFQLLDRKSDGTSEYPIATSEDLRKFLAKSENLGGNPDDYKTLSIPSNMYIWATMNSADQGVFPMDTAFKRRWEFEYIGIDENEDKVKGYEIPISATKKVNWNDLRKAINNKLITLGINEDKLLGPFFLSKTVLDSALDKGMDFVKLFESKVLMYLFEDAAKMKAKQLFNVDEKKFIYSEVCKKFEETGVKVFKFNAEDVVEEHDISIKEDAAPTDGKLF